MIITEDKMNFKKFIVHSYKAIEKDLIIDLTHEKVLALIGLNECGKTTILKAITAFDYRCDRFENEYFQFKDLDKKYIAAGNRTNIQFSISAILSFEDEKEILKKFIFEENLFKNDINGQPLFAKNVSVKDIDEQGNEVINEHLEFDNEKYQQNINEMLNIDIQIKRQMIDNEKNYTIIWDKLQSATQSDQNRFVEFALTFFPEILLFSNKIEYEDRILISDDSISKKIMENLFTNEGNISLSKFFELDDDSRASVIADINGVLNEKFTKKWNDLSINKNFGTLQLELRDDNINKIITIKVNEILKTFENGSEKNYTRQFSLKDRSEGFNWYFKFVLTLLYYPTSEGQRNTKKLYLFDEPGLYLHEHAQINLSKSFLTLSKDNIVIYTTHCHGMLNIDLSNNTDTFSLKNIYIVSKEPNDYIKISPSYDYVDLNFQDSRTASFKPILHALQLEFCNFIKANSPVLIVEGINDFYILHGVLREKLNNLQIFPSMGADNVKKHLPYFIMYGTPFVVLFDNDKKGYECYIDIKENFGQSIANKIVFLNKGNYQNTQQQIDKFEMEDYFIDKKDNYKALIKFKSRNWFSDFAEKIYKKDYRNEINQCDDTILETFEQLLIDIQNKING